MSFTLDGDIYIRYLSFKTAKVRQRRSPMSMFRRCLNRPRRPVQDMEKDMIKRNPEKIDIGAIYNIPAMDRMSVADGAFIPQEREFVIDIDLSDYNDVRTCCDGEPPPAAPAAPSPASRRRRSHCAALAPQPPASARGAGRTCPSPSRSSTRPCAVRRPCISRRSQPAAHTPHTAGRGRRGLRFQAHHVGVLGPSRCALLGR